MNEKTVTTRQYQALLDAIRALADAGDEALARLAEDGKDVVKSTNYPTALRGFEYLAKFIEGTAGTVTTEKSRAIIEPILDERAGKTQQESNAEHVHNSTPPNPKQAKSQRKPKKPS